MEEFSDVVGTGKFKIQNPKSKEIPTSKIQTSPRQPGMVGINGECRGRVEGHRKDEL
jgi:hypothetical protein